MYLGLDYHQSRSSIFMIDQGGNKIVERKIKGPWTTVIDEVKKIKSNHPERLEVCFEASCGSGHLYDQLKQVADRVVVANPTQMRHIFGCKRKNDKIDAEKLAKTLALGAVPQVHVPSLDVREWRATIMFRTRLVAKRTRVKNEIRSLLRNNGQLPPKKLWTKAGMKRLSEVELPVVSRVRLEIMLSELKDLMERVKLVERVLNKIARSHPGVMVLMSIPGVGVRTAEALAAYIDDPSRFGRKTVGAYLGLIPCQYQSGDHNYLGHITKQGPGVARHLLVEASWFAIRKSRTIKNYFERIVDGDPDRRKIAIVATAHYLARVSLALLKNNECWMEKEDRAA